MFVTLRQYLRWLWQDLEKSEPAWRNHPSASHNRSMLKKWKKQIKQQSKSKACADIGETNSQAKHYLRHWCICYHCSFKHTYPEWWSVICNVDQISLCQVCWMSTFYPLPGLLLKLRWSYAKVPIIWSLSVVACEAHVWLVSYVLNSCPSDGQQDCVQLIFLGFLTLSSLHHLVFLSLQVGFYKSEF